VSGGIQYEIAALQLNSSSKTTESFDGMIQLLRLHNPSASLDMYLDARKLIPAVSKLHSTFWVIYLSQFLCVPINTQGQQAINATLQYQKWYVVQATIPTRIMQALLGV
jgi:hypothetical protein